MKTEPALPALDVTSGPYDLSEEELIDAKAEATDFASTIIPWRIPPGHGSYREKRPGLGLQVHAYYATFRADGATELIIECSMYACRIGGETRFPRYIKPLVESPPK